MILFGSETWVMNPRMENSLDGFYHWAVRQMVGMVSKRQLDGKWVYPSIGVVLETVELDNIWLYITFYQNTVAQYIGTHTILDLCLAAERKPGLKLFR